MNKAHKSHFVSFEAKRGFRDITTTLRFCDNEQKQLRQIGDFSIPYAFARNFRQKIVQNGYLQNAAKGV